MARQIEMEVSVDTSKASKNINDLEQEIKDLKKQLGEAFTSWDTALKNVKTNKLQDTLQSIDYNGVKITGENLTNNTSNYEVGRAKAEKLGLEVRNIADKLQQAETNLQKLNSTLNVTDTNMNKANKNTEVLVNNIKETKDEASNTTKNFSNLGDRISSAFENAGKKARRFTLALFSVRSVFSIISKASREYLAENEDTSSKVAGAWSYLGNVIGPVIEKIVSWLQYGIAYLNVFLKALTGVDFLAKSIQKSTAKLNKELKKTVSSMDEIVNLDLDSGSGGPNGAGALQDIADLELNPKVVEFMEKLGNAVKTVWEWAKTAWDFLEEHFGTTGALAIVAGLGLIIGNAGSGLLGISGLLKGIATIGTIAIGVDLLYGALTGRDLIQDLKDIKKGFDDLRGIQEDLDKETEKHSEEWRKTANSMDVAGYSTEELTDLIDGLNISTSQTTDNITSMLKKMEENGSWYMDYTDQIGANTQDLQTNKIMLEKIKTQLEKNQSQLQKGTAEYDKNKQAIDKVNKAINDIDGKLAKVGIVVELTTNYTSFWHNLSVFISGIGKNISNLLSSSGKTGTKKYATGGFPNEGQMFIANEKGPELVGNIGNSTAVVNNNQIVESVSQGVAMAVSSVMSSNNKGNQTATYLYINGSEFAKAVYDDMNSESRRRNKNASIRRA